MAERERNLAAPRTPGGAGQKCYVARSRVLSVDDIRRAITRIAHEIVERNQGTGDLVIVGLQTGGIALAEHIVAALERIEANAVVLGRLDVAFFRDDVGVRSVPAETTTDIPVDLTGRTVVVVDDVLFTGRTVRAALNALNSHGRATSTQLAVMIDRGHRELPIRPDYVGKNLPTRRDEQIDVDVETGVTIGDLVAR